MYVSLKVVALIFCLVGLPDPLMQNTSQRSRCEEKCPVAERVKHKCKTKKTQFLAHFHSSEVREKKDISSDFCYGFPY